MASVTVTGRSCAARAIEFWISSLLAYISTAVTLATAVAAAAMRDGFDCGERSDAPNNARSITSPNTRDVEKAAGAVPDNKPTPVAISRMPHRRMMVL